MFCRVGALYEDTLLKEAATKQALQSCGYEDGLPMLGTSNRMNLKPENREKEKKWIPKRWSFHK